MESRRTCEPLSRFRLLVPLLLILLLAFGLRVWGLTSLPPGLTHDEANHGREAIGILDGVLLFFFPLNYGSEPLYSYTVALFMALLGRGLFALRLVNAVFGTLTIATAYAWAASRLGRMTALTAAARACWWSNGAAPRLRSRLNGPWRSAKRTSTTRRIARPAASIALARAVMQWMAGAACTKRRKRNS